VVTIKLGVKRYDIDIVLEAKLKELSVPVHHGPILRTSVNNII
jgi:hypothetical protein